MMITGELTFSEIIHCPIELILPCLHDVLQGQFLGPYLQVLEPALCSFKLIVNSLTEKSLSRL